MTQHTDSLQSVLVTVGPVTLPGDLALPAEAMGLVVFAHGSGSSRYSPRNQFVARQLNKAGLATLLFDLLTPDEEQIDAYTRQIRFDINFLAGRLDGAMQWLLGQPELRPLPTGYFGASTGAAAALVAASKRPETIRAVVSRGGRPDLAELVLPHISIPTLLIVGSEDEPVLTWNRHALAELHGEKRLAIVPGATHLFEEPGALEAVAELACSWFRRYLPATPPADLAHG